MDYEKQYIEESGDKKPQRVDYDNDKIYHLDLLEWQHDFITWLCKQLEKVEKENKEKLIWAKEKPNYDCVLLTKEPFGEKNIYKIWTINDAFGRNWLKNLINREYLVVEKLLNN